MKNLLLTLLSILTLTVYGQDFTTCTKLDSLIWEKVNEYRTTEDAITKGYGTPNTITNR